MRAKQRWPAGRQRPCPGRPTHRRRHPHACGPGRLRSCARSRALGSPPPAAHQVHGGGSLRVHAPRVRAVRQQQARNVGGVGHGGVVQRRAPPLRVRHARGGAPAGRQAARRGAGREGRRVRGRVSWRCCRGCGRPQGCDGLARQPRTRRGGCGAPCAPRLAPSRARSTPRAGLGNMAGRRAPGQQSLHGALVPKQRGRDQRRHAGAVGLVGARARLQERLHHRRVPAPRRQQQRRLAAAQWSGPVRGAGREAAADGGPAGLASAWRPHGSWHGPCSPASSEQSTPPGPPGSNPLLPHPASSSASTSPAAPLSSSARTTFGRPWCAAQCSAPRPP